MDFLRSIPWVLSYWGIDSASQVAILEIAPCELERSNLIIAIGKHPQVLIEDALIDYWAKHFFKQH